MRPFDIIVKVIPYSPLRIILLKLLGAKVSHYASIQDVSFIGIILGSFRHLTVESGVHLGEGAMIDLSEKVTIEKHVALGPRVVILTHSSPGAASPMIKYYPEQTDSVVIKQGAWIGANSTIMPGVTIGEMSVVGAGSVVLKDVMPYTVVAGIPAKKIKEINTFSKKGIEN